MVLDADDDRISFASPLARLLLGHTTGATVTGRIGDRKVELEILEVSISADDAPATSIEQQTPADTDRIDSAEAT